MQLEKDVSPEKGDLGCEIVGGKNQCSFGLLRVVAHAIKSINVDGWVPSAMAQRRNGVITTRRSLAYMLYQRRPKDWSESQWREWRREHRVSLILTS
jgi:hypothetical protein